MTRGDSVGHWRTHLVEVAVQGGGDGYAFDCPQCGISDLAWGMPGDDPERRKTRASFAMALHMDQRHGISLNS